MLDFDVSLHDTYFIAKNSEPLNQQEQTMDQPIREKTKAEQEADRLAEEQAHAANKLRQWDRHSALSAVVGEREAASGVSGE